MEHRRNSHPKGVGALYKLRYMSIDRDAISTIASLMRFVSLTETKYTLSDVAEDGAEKKLSGN